MQTLLDIIVPIDGVILTTQIRRALEQYNCFERHYYFPLIFHNHYNTTQLTIVSCIASSILNILISSSCCLISSYISQSLKSMQKLFLKFITYTLKSSQYK